MSVNPSNSILNEAESSMQTEQQRVDRLETLASQPLPESVLEKSGSISVVFVTYNRKDLLHKALTAVQQQSVKVEVIVMDDASTDGTDAMMSASFPDVIYQRSEKNLGPSYQRNAGARLATSDIVFFLDDDTVVQDTNTIKTILSDFTEPSFGAVTIPFINILQSDEVITSAPDKQQNYLYHAFIAAAFAVRRSVFLSLGGFREEYFYMGEEDDFCLRLLNAGYYVKAGTSKPVHHFQPAGRISYSADFYGRRNDILFYYLNCPRPLVVPFLILTVFKGVAFGIKVGRLKNMLKGTASGLKLMFDKHIIREKKPVDRNVFFKFRKLKLNGPLELYRA